MANRREDAADRVVLSLGRIHPKKGLDRLVRAWAKVEAAHPDWRLRIVGPAELGHDAELRALAASLNLSRVSIEPAIYGEEKYTAFREADIFVLPTLNENFAMTVAESLAAGTPVISTKGAPWAGLEVERCGWWIDHGIEPLAAALAVRWRCHAKSWRNGQARPSLGGARLRMGRDRRQDGSGLCLAGGQGRTSRMGIARVTAQ